MVRATDESFFKHLIDQKEREIVKLWEERIYNLEEKLSLREVQITALSENFSQLQEDFQYNLSLLETRDAELETYDTSFSELQAALADGEKLLKEARSALADAEARCQEETRTGEENEAQYKQKLVELREQLEQAQWRFEEELRKQRQGFEALNGDLMRQVSDAQEQLDFQRRELTLQYEENLRKQEVDSQQALNEAAANAFASEQQCKKLERAIRLMDEGVEQLQADSAPLHAALEAKKRQAEALIVELEKVQSLRESERTALQAQLAGAKRSIEEMEDDFGQKIAELVAALGAVQQMMASQEEEHASKLAMLSRRSEDEIAALKSKFAAATKRSNEAEEEKLQEAETYKHRVRELETKVEQQAADAKRSLEESQAGASALIQRLETTRRELTDQLWQKGAELDAAQSKLDATVRAMEERRADVANYKEQLVAAATREKELHRQVVQATLRGEQEAEEKERRALARSEALILSLQQQRDHANRLHKQAEERAVELANELQRLVKSNQSASLRKPQNLPTPRPSSPRDALPSSRRLQIAVASQGGETSSLGSPLPAPSPMPSLGLSYAASPRPLMSPRRHVPTAGTPFEALDEAGESRFQEVEITDDLPEQTVTNQGGNYVNDEESQLAQENELLRHSLAGLAAQNEQIRAVVHDMRGEMEELQKRAAVAATPRAARRAGFEDILVQNSVEDAEEKEREPSMVLPPKNNIEPAQTSAAVPSGTSESGNAPQEVDQLRQELGLVQQRLAKMTAQLGPVLTTVGHLQGAGLNAPFGALNSLHPESAPMQGVPFAATLPVGSGFSTAGLDSFNQTAPPGELSAALEEVQRLSEERDRLMELSNALRADLKKRGPSNPPPNQAPNPDSVPTGKAAVPLRLITIQPPHASGVQPKVTANLPEWVRKEASSKRAEGGALLSATATSAVQLPRAPAAEIIHKGTASQRAKLKASQQRRQEEAPKVRNYNIRDTGVET